MASGKSQVLFSSTVTANAYVGRSFNVRGFGETQILIDPVAITSGQSLSYKIAGYPNVEDAPGYSIPLLLHGNDVTDIALYSGCKALYKVGDAFDKVVISVKNTTSNKSGRITVIATGKRRR